MAHVLIVEDDEWLAGTYVAGLAKDGHTTSIVQDPFSALDAMDEKLPDVIVLDVLLTGQNGIALLHEMQSYVDLASIPVVLCTSIAVEQHEVAAYGVRMILDKTTMKPDDIRSAVRGVL